MHRGTTEGAAKVSLDASGHIIYKIPCSICGTEVIKKRNGFKKTLCKYCELSIKKKSDALISKELLEIETPAEKRFKTAMERIKKQVQDFESYQKAIEIAKTRVEKYASIPEAMVAIELIRLKYCIIPQQKVGKYKVDFAIPKQKLVVEVDGELYHRNDKKKDREASIQFSLGLSWKIIHIPAELIASDITKLKEIMKLYG